MLNTHIPISEQIHKQVLDALDDCIYVINAQVQLLACNQAFKDMYCAYYGEPPQIDAAVRALYLDDFDSERLKHWYVRGFDGERFSESVSYEDKSIEFSIRPLWAENGCEVAAVLVHIKEVTRAYQLQETVSEQQERYQYVIDNVHDILFQTDAQGNWIFLNRAWTKVMQFGLEESLGKPFFQFLHPEDVEKNQLLFEPLVQRKKSYCKHIIRYIRKDGAVRWLEVFATLSLDKNDQIIGTAGTLKDLTNEMKNAHIYELLSNNVKDLVCIHDLEGKYLYVSPSIKALTGFEPTELIGQSLYQYIHQDDLNKLSQRYGSISRTINNIDYIDYRFKRKDDTYVWLEANAKVFFDEYDIAYRVISSSREIEERKQAEKSMIKALLREKELNELMGKFVNFASHEFRTPLATIRTSTEIIEAYTEQLPDKSGIHKHTYHIHTEINRITRLIDEILMIGKIDSEQLVAHKAPADLVELLRLVIERQNGLQTDARKAILSIEGTPYWVSLDSQQIDIVLDNLLSNAFKYSIGKPNPTVKLLFEIDAVSIFIQDYGIGIPSEAKEKLFTSFFRASNVGAIKGTGLGLVIVKSFVQLNGGDLSFVSSPQEGTTFCVKFFHTFES